MQATLVSGALLLAFVALPDLATAQAIRTFPGTFISGGITRTAEGIVFAGSERVVVRGSGGSADPWTYGIVVRLRTAAPSGYTRTKFNYGFLNQVSPDGSQFVGAEYPSPDVSLNGGMAFRATDTPSPAITPLSSPDPSAALGFSADKSVVVGTVGDPYERAARWVGNQAAQDLGVLPGKFTSLAYATSADGSVVVGESEGVPFRWTEGEGMTALPLPAGSTAAKAVAVSADGATILIVPTEPLLGNTTSALWTQVGGLQSLGGKFTAVAMTPNASRVFGQQGLVPPEVRVSGEPVVWTPGAGLRTLKAVAKAEAGMNLDDWRFDRTLAMSPDGKAFAVHGTRSGYGGLQIITLAGRLPNVPALVSVRPENRVYRLPKTGVARAKLTIGSANPARLILTATGGFRRTHRPTARPWIVTVPLRPGLNRVRVEAVGPGGRAVATARLKARRL